MPKLPKSLLKQRKQKMTEVRGSSSKKGGGGTSRAMRRKLQSQGIDQFEQIDGVQKVLIQCSDKELIIENPQVIKLTQQGMTVYQVVGESIERELSTSSDIEMETDDSVEQISHNIEEPLEEITSTSEIKKQDIILVATQANVSEEEAKAALEEADGDLAKAILKLKTM
ncbi:MAG: nascent polypeptide-associated complex protein [Promethearchaeota archaeon]